jgi:tight adherence protein B
MSSGLIIVWAIVLVLAASGLLLYQRAQDARGRGLTESFANRAVIAPASTGAMMPSAHKPRARGREAAPSHVPPGGVRDQLRRMRSTIEIAFGNTMSRAGIQKPRVFVTVTLACTLASTLWIGARTQWVIGLVFLPVGSVCAFAILSWRAQKRYQRIARQLPVFLDSIVRLITIGNSVPAAFQGAFVTTDMPLRECLDRVSRMLRSGVEIDVALTQMAKVYHVRELGLIGSVLRISVKFGGRSDVMLDRMAGLMRDLEQADRELIALSTETRLSSWILGLLPVLLGGFVIIAHPSYFNAMWSDRFGQRLVFVAFGLQLLGAFLLYRLARLRR